MEEPPPPEPAELVIVGGELVDGTGSAPRIATVVIRGGVVSEVLAPDRRIPDAAEVIDAGGCVVTPGFVDIHTHFDGQATWDPRLQPSTLHGVTSIAMGNCGVGFAPARPEHREWLVELLEGVEDIPGTALHEGLDWSWETFPDYLDVLDAKDHTADIGAHLPHSAVRLYVMGDRGADPDQVPDADELQRISAVVAEALAAGALGVATSRTVIHRTSRGEPVPTLGATQAELLSIAEALRRADRGVVQLISDLYQTTDDAVADAELDLIGDIARRSGRPVSFTMQQAFHSPDRWRHQLAWIDDAVRDGLDVVAQVAPRPIGVLLGLEATLNPFSLCRSYGEIAGLRLDERVDALADPERRRRILDEHAELCSHAPEGLLRQITAQFDLLFPLDDPVDYRLDPDRSIAAVAARQGRSPSELAYDLVVEESGRRLLYLPLFNFAHRSLGDLREMIAAPNTIFGLSDAGAHCGAICDASFATSALTMWCRDAGADAFPIETIVAELTRRTAEQVGWLDRGVVAPGFVADLNVIDFAELGCRPPRISHDLPAGGRRLTQDATGYRYTVKSGVVTHRDGRHQGRFPGRLIRGATLRPTS